MANARLEMRLDEAVKAKVERASVLSGSKTVTDYVVKTLSENASEVIEKYESGITLRNSIFDEFWSACEKAEAPNSALIAAAKFSEEKGFK